MSIRNAVRVVSFCLAAVLVAAGFMVKSELKLRRYKTEIQNSYSRSLEGLSSSINNISVILEKSKYVTTARQQSRLAAELLSQSESAKNALSELPTGGKLQIINRFLSQVGNYAMAVSKTLLSGEDFGKDYEGNLEALKTTAQKISKAIGESSISYNNPTSWTDELDQSLNDAALSGVLAESLTALEDTLTDYPKLVYDGPYSDHILEKEPLMIKDAQKVGAEIAKETAAEAAECEEGELNFDETVEGKIPTYRFSGENVNVTVSIDGGYTVFMRKTRQLGDFILDYKQAISKAKRYLNKIGMNGFIETYYYTDEGVCVINFAFLDGRTVCYTDLVKVGVAMDTGEILLYEASGYLTNHTSRAFETAAVSSEEAAKVVSDKLKITQTALALIPTDSGKEVRCYEFVCKAEDGQEILVYINAVTLEEEDILILLKSDGGTLTK